MLETLPNWVITADDEECPEIKIGPAQLRQPEMWLDIIAIPQGHQVKLKLGDRCFAGRYEPGDGWYLGKNLRLHPAPEAWYHLDFDEWT